jgi:cyanophycinase
MSGYIFAIGGGNKIDQNIFKTMLTKSKNKNVLLINDASTYTFTNHTQKAINYFNKYSNVKINIIKLANTNLNIDQTLFNHGIIYFTGGNQTHLLNNINKINGKQNINISKLLINYLSKGGVVGGTSAGASILGSYMPTGGIDSKKQFEYYIGKTKLTNKIHSTKPALGLLNMIIDQHFSEKNRHLRGIDMTLRHKMPLIGLDENTAMYIKYNSNKMHKLGLNNVFLYDGSNARFNKYNNKIIVTNFKKYNII